MDDTASAWEDPRPAQRGWILYAGLVTAGVLAGVGVMLVLGRTPSTPEPRVEPTPEPAATASVAPKADAPSPALAEPEAIAEPPADPEPPVTVVDEPAKAPAPKAKATSTRTKTPPAEPKTPTRDDNDAPSSPAEPDLAAADLAAKGNAAFNAGQYAQAAKDLERAVRKAPREANYRISLGDAYFKQGRHSAAKTHYEKAAELGHPAAARRLEKISAADGG